jgi:hypothetical protein
LRGEETAERYREFAERVIARSHGMDLPEVKLGELATELAREIPVPDGAVIVGSVTYRRNGKQMRSDAYIDARGEIRDVLAFYEERLRARGWKVAAPQPAGMHGGFVAMAPGFGSIRTFVRGDEGPFIGVSVKSGRGGMLDVAAHWDSGIEGLHPAAPRRPLGVPLAEGLVPVLLPPDGIEVIPGGSGGSDADWRTEAEAFTDTPPSELEAHYADQLAQAGWTRQDGSTEGPLAWSRWRLRADQYEGMLLVLRLPVPARQLLLIRVESARARERRSGRVPIMVLG